MRTVFAAVLAAGLFAAMPAAQSNMAKPEKFTAFAVDINNTSPRNNTTSIDMTITRWTTDAERDQLRETLSKGEPALLSALQKLPPVGYINTPGSLRYDLRYAREQPQGDGGRMITLATDRYITAWEAFHQPRSIDYPFTIIQLKVDKNGDGVGKASVATRITQKKDGTIELEDFEAQPVMLNEVHLQK
jgi:hypothetical protein